MPNYKVTFDTKTQIELLVKQNKELQTQVKYERKLRAEAERKVVELEESLTKFKETKVRKRRTKAEVEAEREQAETEYSEFNKLGKRKAHKASSISSYSEFKAIQDYFLAKNHIRDYMMWTVGVCFGLRISDLRRIKWKNVMNEDMTFRERIKMYEKKTDKLQNCLITEAVVDAFVKYLNSISWQFSFEDSILKSTQSSEPISEVMGWKILNKAKDDLGLDKPFGSHSMRNSFSNIILCVDKNTIDMNAITKIQGLLNHSDPRTTMRYLGTLNEMYDKARIVVSDFVLGRTGVDKLVAGGGGSYDEVIDRLEKISSDISELKSGE